MSHRLQQSWRKSPSQDSPSHALHTANRMAGTGNIHQQSRTPGRSCSWGSWEGDSLDTDTGSLKAACLLAHVQGPVSSPCASSLQAPSPGTSSQLLKLPGYCQGDLVCRARSLAWDTSTVNSGKALIRMPALRHCLVGALDVRSLSIPCHSQPFQGNQRMRHPAGPHSRRADGRGHGTP